MAKSNQNFIQPGMRFSRWTVLEPHPENGKKWLCRCDCGTERYVTEKGLRYGESKSCGCLRKENAREASAHDLTGQVFGQLTVLEQVENPGRSGGIWWRCRCSCGESYEVPGTLLTSGRRTHCGGKLHEKKRARADITGQRFGRLTALYPTGMRDKKGFVIWHCRCDCGNELDLSYNSLLYCTVKSCGCQKREHEQKLNAFLTHVDGTSIDAIRSTKIPTDNTSGHKGVYLIRGKYVAKIVFQKKQYFLGAFDRIQDAAAARTEAEQILFGGASDFYALWQAKAAEDPAWAAENPVRIEVSKDSSNRLQLQCYPSMDHLHNS